ncbi:MAG: acetyltransferase [Betaproteobacteria bacterium]|nr:MAG: acetyltransferase [Betaproteobacteria bacterium]
MTCYYAFNGDADGLCALQQLRLVETQPATLVTGVKRDITLLRRIPGQGGDAVTVLDVSLHKNREDLLRLLEAGASVRYFDHHYAGTPPWHSLLEVHIDEAADVCTSILVDRHIGGRYRAWAVVAAFGDNLTEPARAMALQAGLNAQATAALEKLGICLNYNAYGESLEDLHCHPAELADLMMPFRDPASFIEQTEICAKLDAGYNEDMANARRVATRGSYREGIIVLPNEPWARRAIGVLTNELVQDRPGAALAILSPKASGGFTVSVRVPAESAVSAAEFCGGFETGGGRKSAGGINYLPEADLDRFTARFEARFGTR